MLETTLNFIVKYKAVLLFYLVIIVWLIFKRKNLEIQNKFIVLYKMKFGLKLIEKVSTKFREWVILFGYIGIGAGFIGMLLIAYVLIKNIYDLLFVPSAVSGVSLVLPGVNIPGIGILPFWHWLLAILVIAVVHEFSHGIVARAHNIEVKSTGMVFMGPIIGAFVEPDEKKMVKNEDYKQYSVLAAGPFSNVLLALLALVLMLFVFSPLQENMTTANGFTFDAYYNNSYPIAQAGIAPGTIINGINGKAVTDFESFASEISGVKPGEEITLNTMNGTATFALTTNPDGSGKGFLGISQIHNSFDVKEAYLSGIGKVAYSIVDWLVEFMRWIFLLSLGIGLFNLLPLPIVDGGRMMQVFLWKLKGKEKGDKWYGKISLFFLLVLILSLIFPYIMKWFGV